MVGDKFLGNLNDSCKELQQKMERRRELENLLREAERDEREAFRNAAIAWESDHYRVVEPLGPNPYALYETPQ